MPRRCLLGTAGRPECCDNSGRETEGARAAAGSTGGAWSSRGDVTSTPPPAAAQKTTGTASGRRREISRVSHYLGVNVILLAGREAPLVPEAPCGAAEGACKTSQRGRGEGREGGSEGGGGL